MTMLKFSDDLSLPMNAVTQKLAFLGISGSGKTYGAGKFAELLLHEGAQVVVIDTIGNWWGLRLGADGKKNGISIPILGGERGDVPLEPTAGVLVADTAAETRSSLIVDVSDFTGGELRRFVTDFATRLLRRKKQHKSPVMVIWEECQDIVPQFVRGDTATMVGAVEKLIKKGRNYGVGTVLISQRPQAVNKDVLNQVETLFAFRTGGAQERKAIQEWIVHRSINVGEYIDQLPSLDTGSCYCWSPQWLKTLKLCKVAKKTTYDASATPEFGDDERARDLAPVDLERFKKTMSDAIEKAKANDPEALKKRVAELERELKAKPEKPEIKTVERSVLKEADLKRVETALEKFASFGEKALEAVGDINLTLRVAKATLVSTAPLYIAADEVEDTLNPQYFAADDGALHPKQNSPAGGLSKCAREILRALAEKHPQPLTRTQVATLSGYSQNSSGFANALSELNTKFLIAKIDGEFGLTGRGASQAPRVQQPKTKAQLFALWASRLAGKEAHMLACLIQLGPMPREDLASQAGLSPTSSGFANYLSKLNSNGLIKKEGSLIRASEEFV